MNFKANETPTKLRGGYYTELPIALFLTRWVLSTNPARVMEPSCGDGIFLEAADLLAQGQVEYLAVEIEQEEAQKAAERSRNYKLTKTSVIPEDFLAWVLPRLETEFSVDAVVGNPPYIRYQYLGSESQLLAERVFRRFNLDFTKHTNAWVPFVIASIASLAPGGRIAMVIPSEILHVLHAQSLRKYLIQTCRRILLIDPNELLFSGALQGTMLLLAEKKLLATERSDGVAIVPFVDNTFLNSDPDAIFQSAAYVSGERLNGKWMKVLLTQTELDLFEHVGRLRDIKTFAELATVDVGIVTGANKFFLVDDSTVAKYQLENLVHPMFGRSEHCPGIVYDMAVHLRNRKNGLPANFVMFGNTPRNELSKGALDYITEGEKARLDTRYKCRIRSPWYNVPSVYSTPVGMLKRCHNYPRLIFNEAGAFTTDTAYRIRPHAIDAKTFVFCFINSVTALSAELEGRHYGGGVLELVPSEIEKVLVPVPRGVDVQLEVLDQMVASNVNPGAIMQTQDQAILSRAGLSVHDQGVLRNAWSRIRDRRHRSISNDALADSNSEE